MLGSDQLSSNTSSLTLFYMSPYSFLFFYISVSTKSSTYFLNMKIIEALEIFFQPIFFHLQRATLLEYFNKCIFSKPLLSFDAHALHLYIILWENPSYFWKISREASQNNIKWYTPKKRFIFDPLKCHWSTCKTFFFLQHVSNSILSHVFFFNCKYLVSQVSSFATWYI